MVSSRRSQASEIAAFAFLVLVFVLAPASRGAQAQAGKIDELGPLTDATVSRALVESLSPKGYRISFATGGSEIEIWYCKDLAVRAKSPAADAEYSGVPESSLVGVLHFTKNSSDYRGQSVPAGFYTLRYALMPNDGNHLGVAPGRDFLLLVPVAADPGPQKTLAVTDLIALSGRASGTRHPAPMSLVPAASDGAKPTLSRDDQGNVVFTTSMHLANGRDLPISLVVKGTAPQ